MPKVIKPLTNDSHISLIFRYGEDILTELVKKISKNLSTVFCDNNYMTKGLCVEFRQISPYEICVLRRLFIKVLAVTLTNG